MMEGIKLRSNDPVSLGCPKTIWEVVRDDPNDEWGMSEKVSVCTTEQGLARALVRYDGTIRKVIEVTCTYKELK
jgi:hypothetical protein